MQEQGFISNYQMGIKSKDGKIIYIELSASFSRDQKGDIVGTVGEIF